MGSLPVSIGWAPNHHNKPRTGLVLISDNKSRDIYTSKTQVHVHWWRWVDLHMTPAWLLRAECLCSVSLRCTALHYCAGSNSVYWQLSSRAGVPLFRLPLKGILLWITLVHYKCGYVAPNSETVGPCQQETRESLWLHCSVKTWTKMYGSWKAAWACQLTDHIIQYFFILAWYIFCLQL